MVCIPLSAIYSALEPWICGLGLLLLFILPLLTGLWWIMIYGLNEICWLVQCYALQHLLILVSVYYMTAAGVCFSVFASYSEFFFHYWFFSRETDSCLTLLHFDSRARLANAVCPWSLWMRKSGRRQGRIDSVVPAQVKNTWSLQKHLWSLGFAATFASVSQHALRSLHTLGCNRMCCGFLCGTAVYCAFPSPQCSIDVNETRKFINIAPEHSVHDTHHLSLYSASVISCLLVDACISKLSELIESANSRSWKVNVPH